MPGRLGSVAEPEDLTFSVSRKCSVEAREFHLVQQTLDHCSNPGGTLESPVKFTKPSCSWDSSLEILIICSSPQCSNQHSGMREFLF